MPRLSCWFIRTALICLAAGFTLGGALLFHKGLPLSPGLWRVMPIHVELVLVGWTMQLAMGVAFWILPRFGRGAARGNEAPAWLAYLLLNLGLGSLSLGWWLGWPAPVLAPLGRAAELLAALAFAVHAWPRVKALGA